MTPTPSGVAVERLEEILAAAGKATPGPWETIETKGAGPYAVINPAGDAELGNWSIARQIWWAENATHIANCDPQTITSIIRELLLLRSSEAVSRDGRQTVPREPTGKMLLAPDVPRWGQYRTHEKQAIYAAMIAAAPTPQDEGTGE